MRGVRVGLNFLLADTRSHAPKVQHFPAPVYYMTGYLTTLPVHQRTTNPRHYIECTVAPLQSKHLSS